MLAVTTRLLKGPSSSQFLNSAKKAGSALGPELELWLGSKCLRALWQVPFSLWPGAPRPEEVVGWSVRLVSALKFGLSRWPQPHSRARVFRGGECLSEAAQTRGSRRPVGQDNRGRSAVLRLFTSLGPTPAAAGPPGEHGAIGRTACQSPGTFPGVGQPGPPLALPRPSPFPGAGGELRRQSLAWAATRGWTRTVRPCPQGPHPQVSRLRLSKDGGGGRESGTRPFRASAVT